MFLYVIYMNGRNEARGLKEGKASMLRGASVDLASLLHRPLLQCKGSLVSVYTL